MWEVRGCCASVEVGRDAPSVEWPRAEEERMMGAGPGPGLIMRPLVGFRLIVYGKEEVSKAQRND